MVSCSKIAFFSVLSAVVKAQAQFGMLFVEGTNLEICLLQYGSYHNDLDPGCNNDSSLFFINNSASPRYTFTNGAGANCGLLHGDFACGAGVPLTPFLINEDPTLDGFLTTVDGNGFTADAGTVVAGGSQSIFWENFTFGGGKK